MIKAPGLRSLAQHGGAHDVVYEKVTGQDGRASVRTPKWIVAAANERA